MLAVLHTVHQALRLNQKVLMHLVLLFSVMKEVLINVLINVMGQDVM